MKNLLSLLFVCGLLSGPVFSEELNGFDIGVSVLGSQSDSTGEYEVNGMLFMSYEGYEKSINDDSSMYILPTSIEIDVQGEKVQVYTDLATLHNYRFDNLELAISAISIDYKKYNNFAIRENGKAALIDMSATKFFPVGSLEVDISAGLAAGGVAEHTLVINDGTEFDSSSKHHVSIDFGAGIDIPITDTMDLYGYAGHMREKGDNYEAQRTYFGAELYGVKPSRNSNLIPFLRYSTDKFDGENSILFPQNDSPNFQLEDSLLELGFRYEF